MNVGIWLGPVISAGLSAAGFIASAAISRRSGRGEKELTKAQREDVVAQTAERVQALNEAERQILNERIDRLQGEVNELRHDLAARVSELQHSRGEAEALRAEVGHLRATLVAREAELAALRAQQQQGVTVTVGGGTTA